MKKKIKIIFITSIVFIILLVAGGFYAKQKYDEYLYHQTNEYKFLEKGYTLDEIATLEKTLDEEHITLLIDSEEKQEIYLNLINEKYFLIKNLDKYIEYYNNNPNKELKDIITVINTNTDKAFYSIELKTNVDLDKLMLVNKYYQINQDYKPQNLVSISTNYSWGNYGDHQVREDVLNAFLKMHAALYQELNVWLMVNSSYRDYESQQNVWNNYKNKKGTEYADSIAARPGSSEHQTGLVLDIFSKAHTTRATFKDSEEYVWLLNNAHKYGFILRYPEGKEAITGYDFEAWHYRYVGIQDATKIYNENLTFDEYYAYYLDK